MKKFKGTPGPWVAFSNTKTGTFAVHTPDDKSCGNIIAWSGFDGVDSSNKVKAANVALIAAAPELLEALQNMINHNCPNGHSFDCNCAYNAGKLAITKALG